jgi:hypothetical protein
MATVVSCRIPSAMCHPVLSFQTFSGMQAEAQATHAVLVVPCGEAKS